MNKCIYKISLPEEQDVEAFVKFMREEYFSAVERGPTRVGMVTDLVLLQRLDETADNTHEFFWHVGWSGLPGCRDSFVSDEEVLRKFESFSPRVEFLGYYAGYGEGEE